jgi:hypothetical protein
MIMNEKMVFSFPFSTFFDSLSAERVLLHLKSQPSFLKSLSEIIGNENFSLPVRQSASIIFKNCIRELWMFDTATENVCIDQSERMAIKVLYRELSLIVIF